MNIKEVPVVQTNIKGQVPTASVIAEAKGGRPHTRTELKRNRYVFHLKENYRRLKESLQYVEHFSKICELSEEKITAIQKAKEEALEELSQKFREKLNIYDKRIQEERS